MEEFHCRQVLQPHLRGLCEKAPNERHSPIIKTVTRFFILKQLSVKVNIWSFTKLIKG
jgi:hypothetical protein